MKEKYNNIITTRGKNFLILKHPLIRETGYRNGRRSTTYNHYYYYNDREIIEEFINHKIDTCIVRKKAKKSEEYLLIQNGVKQDNEPQLEEPETIKKRH